jgi:histone H3/H4
MIKRAIKDKVDTTALDELEDEYCSNIDKLTKTFTKKFVEKADIKRILKNMDRQVKLL